MTHWHIEVDLTCPSDWDERKARMFVEKFCCPSEKATIKVTPLRDMERDAK